VDDAHAVLVADIAGVIAAVAPGAVVVPLTVVGGDVVVLAADEHAEMPTATPIRSTVRTGNALRMISPLCRPRSPRGGESLPLDAALVTGQTATGLTVTG
jgi:hypothetical protein